MYLQNLKQIVVLILGLTFFAGAFAADEDPGKRTKPNAPVTGWYVAAGLSSVDIGGDMNGRALVSGGGSAEILPSWSAAQGLQLALGYQVPYGDMELSHERADLDGQWEGIPTEGEFEAWNLDTRLRFANQYRVKPFLLLGLDFNTITVRNGSTDGFRLADAEFRSGLDFRLGGGAYLPVGNRFGVSMQGVYRFGDINRVEGIASGNLDDELDGAGFTYTAQLRIIFGKRK
ncbi:hypothetical protein ABI59_20775 [Acidobacteria bacterium Mor1]|nr:hypothetical protein ABI59_20775 [Acidobacteria bacterium Mor1]